VFLLEYRRKWVVVDKLGKIVIITRDKNIAIGFAKLWRAENDRVR